MQGGVPGISLESAEERLNWPRWMTRIGQRRNLELEKSQEGEQSYDKEGTIPDGG